MVVSANWYNREESNCILVPITSTVHDPLARYEILVQGIEVKRAGLLYDSVIRAGHPFTIEQTLIIRSLGQVTLKQLASVVEHLQDTLHN